MYIQKIQGIFQTRLGTADNALVTSSLHYNDSLDTWTVVHMTAAKFKPLIIYVMYVVWQEFIYIGLEDSDRTFLQNVGTTLQDYTAKHPQRQ
jgi:hypothetical protein